MFNIDKNVKIQDIKDTMMPSSDVWLKIKQLYETGKYPHMEAEALTQTYATFKSLYGKEALKKLKGKELLYRIFGTKAQDELFLTYAIERGKEYADFGSCCKCYSNT